ncbi:MAG TPA: pyridoxal-phosphate dependent enzyme [Bryobacteraceae bacterium]|nr:pyridoxal-phosphate dependent enzyme [Bryobacteraceae bacterium]
MSASETPSFTGPDLQAIREAHRRIVPHIEETQVMISYPLDELAGALLYFKCENLQLSGSFKIRGAANAVFSLSEAEAARGVVTHSSGNHGAALALAAQMRGIRAWVVMPRNAPQVKVRAVEAYGADISFCEPTLAAREAAAAELLRSTGGTLIHPYDDDRVIAGQGTAALEFLEEIPDLDILCAPVSGGGLLSGTAIAAKSLRPEIVVIGCEPANADDASRSLASGQLEPGSEKFTIADGLRATLSPRTFAILRERVDRIMLVTEKEIIDSMRLITEHLRITVEPSGAVAAAPALHRQIEGEELRIGIILSGGNLDPDTIPSQPDYRARPERQRAPEED